MGSREDTGRRDVEYPLCWTVKQSRQLPGLLLPRGGTWFPAVAPGLMVTQAASPEQMRRLPEPATRCLTSTKVRLAKTHSPPSNRSIYSQELLWALLWKGNPVVHSAVPLAVSHPQAEPQLIFLGLNTGCVSFI